MRFKRFSLQMDFDFGAVVASFMLFAAFLAIHGTAISAPPADRVQSTLALAPNRDGGNPDKPPVRRNRPLRILHGEVAGAVSSAAEAAMTKMFVEGAEEVDHCLGVLPVQPWESSSSAATFSFEIDVLHGDVVAVMLVVPDGGEVASNGLRGCVADSVLEWQLPTEIVSGKYRVEMIVGSGDFDGKLPR